METVEGLKRQIDSTKELSSVVRTMKALSAASIRQYEEAVESLNQFSRTIELGFQIVLKNLNSTIPVNSDQKEGRIAAVIFGSDQGMCGQFNDIITEFALEKLEKTFTPGSSFDLWIVGERLLGPIFQAGLKAHHYYPVPSSVETITDRVQELLMDLEKIRKEENLQEIYLFYNIVTGSNYYRQHYLKLLPMDTKWMEGLQKKPWPARTVPMASMDYQSLFSVLTRQYLFISLYRALAESLAAENAARLVTMEAAQKNIEEKEEELENRYNRLRQTEITSELLDIVSGFVALEEEES